MDWRIQWEKARHINSVASAFSRLFDRCMTVHNQLALMRPIKHTYSESASNLEFY